MLTTNINIPIKHKCICRTRSIGFVCCYCRLNIFWPKEKLEGNRYLLYSKCKICHCNIQVFLLNLNSTINRYTRKTILSDKSRCQLILLFTIGNYILLLYIIYITINYNDLLPLLMYGKWN